MSLLRLLTLSLRLSFFFKQCRREQLLLLRHCRFLIHSMLFLLTILFLFPLSLNPDPELLHSLAPGIYWLSMLLAFFVSTDQFFQSDYEAGIMEQWLFFPEYLPRIVLAKVLVHCFFSSLILILISPLFALLYGLNYFETGVLVLSILCASPGLFFLSSIASAFALGLNQRSALISLIVLPLSLPLLVFGSGTLTLAMHALPIYPNLALLAAFSLMLLALGPYLVSALIQSLY